MEDNNNHSSNNSNHGSNNNKSGYNIELFVDPEEAQKYLCSICHHVVSDCHETSCGHIFCGGCISRVLVLDINGNNNNTESYKCPLCQQHNNGAPHQSIYLNRSVKALKVKCPFNITGCKWIGSLSDLMIDKNNKNDKNNNCSSSKNGHLINCQFAPIICDECNNKICRVQYEIHRKQCLKSCPNCNIIFGSISERKLHYQQCPIMVHCPHCKIKIKKSELRHHISFLCSLREIKCPFYHFGCHEIIKSLNLTNHLKYNAAQHYQLKVDHCLNKMEKMKLQIENYQKKQNQLIKQNESLTKQLKEIIINQNNEKNKKKSNSKKKKNKHKKQNESLTNSYNNDDDDNESSHSVISSTSTSSSAPSLPPIANNMMNINNNNNNNSPDILFLFGTNKWEETGVFIRRFQLHENRVCYTSLRTKCAIRWNSSLNAWLIDRRGLANDNEASLIAYQNVKHPGLVNTKWLVYNDDIEQWQQSTNYKIKSYNLAEFIFKIDQIFANSPNNNDHNKLHKHNDDKENKFLPPGLNQKVNKR